MMFHYTFFWLVVWSGVTVAICLACWAYNLVRCVHCPILFLAQILCGYCQVVLSSIDVSQMVWYLFVILRYDKIIVVYVNSPKKEHFEHKKKELKGELCTLVQF